MPTAQTFKFNFKSRAIKDETGKEIGRTKKQPSIVCDLPVLERDELIAVLSSGTSKEIEIIKTAVDDLIYQAARSQFDEIIDAFSDNDQEVSASMLDFNKLSLEYIASIPAAQRGVTAISEEDWVTFFDDYVQVMVAATGKPLANINNHVVLFKRPAKVKANKEVMALLVDQLDVYMASSPNLDDTGACANRLSSRYAKWLSEPEKAIDLSVL